MQDTVKSEFSHNKGEILASIVLVLRLSDTSFPMPRWLGSETRIVFYNMLLEADPLLSHRVHEELDPKPFTVSSLIKRKKGQYQIRFTILMNEIYTPLIKILLDKFRNGNKIGFEAREFEIERVVLGGIDEKFATITDYRSLWQNTPRRDFRFRFVSPTSFRSGDGNLPFPLPYSLYNGLLKKWNSYAPSDLIIDQAILQEITKRVFPARHSIRTVLAEQRNTKLIGFVGRCIFEVLGEVSDDTLHKLTVLTEYAYFAGVGMKTAQGMGQILIERNYESVGND
jgi:CRISPR-associated endoribonuclease Cas6